MLSLYLFFALCRYWNNDARQRDAATSDQLLFILTDLYCPATEHHFLGYATQFLLEATVRTPDYSQKIFKEPLQKCHFEDFRMLLSWRAQHATIVPLFADTLASQLIQSQSLSNAGEITGAGPVLRATQTSLAFQPTVEQSKHHDLSLMLSHIVSVYFVHIYIVKSDGMISLAKM
jgi:hypothetical protein